MIPFLVIGYGNTLRSDDGVGPKIAEAIASLSLAGVETVVCDLLTPELADPISRTDAVIFIDAAVDCREVQMRPIAPAVSSQIMAHAADPSTLLALARDVFGRAPKGWCLAIPVANLGIGESLSPLAQRGMTSAIEKIKNLAAGKLLGLPVL
jgi:hydrogenase maturation protease